MSALPARIARQLLAVELKRGIGGVFDLDRELGRVVDVLQHAKARAAECLVEWRGAADEREYLPRVAQRPHLDLQHPFEGFIRHEDQSSDLPLPNNPAIDAENRSSARSIASSLSRVRRQR